MVRVRCHFDGKALVPDEPVELPQGQELVALVVPASPEPPRRPVATEGDTPTQPKSFLRWAAANPIDDASLPDDLTTNLDHYLYGSAKREE